MATSLSSSTPRTLFLDGDVPRYDPGHPLAPGNYYRLGKLTGLARQHISRALRGRSGLSFEAAQRIAEAAGVSVDEVKEWIEEAHKRNGKTVKRKVSEVEE